MWKKNNTLVELFISKFKCFKNPKLQKYPKLGFSFYTNKLVRCMHITYLHPLNPTCVI